MKEEKFNQIVADNSERIRRICQYYNSNIDDQNDMYQEILINIWKSLDHFRGDSNISTWIYRIAVNTSLSFTGKAFRHMKLMVDIDTPNLSSLFEDEENHQLLEARLSGLQNELNQLSVIDKALMSLFLEGLSMKEIANVIGITEANVKVKIHRIKTDLRTQMNNHHEL